MEHSNSLQQVVKDTAAEMERLGYSVSSMKHYHEVWNRYLKFTDSDTVDRADMDRFLAREYGISSNKPTRYQRSALRSMNVLEHYFRTGKIYIRFPLASPVSDENVLSPAADEFLSWMKGSGYAASTAHTHERVVRRFLSSAAEHGVGEISSVRADHIFAFIQEITDHNGKVSYELNSLRVFFRYLYHSGKHIENLALLIPASNRLRLREHLPSVWEEDDIRAILQCIDRGNPVGKRDYAMILLAVRLGLRGSDIKSLRFSNLDWEKDTLTVIQQKTGESLTLPLTEEVGMALVDYLREGRPFSDEPYIFLSQKAPYQPLSKENHLHQVLNKYIRRSGVILYNDRAHGMHSLRHTLASNLLKQGTPLPVISGILGHRDSGTTMEYLRIDMEQLRSCTLEVEVPYGK